MTTAKEIGDKWKSKIIALQEKRKQTPPLKFGKQVYKEVEEVKEFTLNDKCFEDLCPRQNNNGHREFYTLDLIHTLKLYDDNLNHKYQSKEEQFKHFEGKTYYIDRPREYYDEINRELLNKMTTLIDTYKLENTLEKKEEKSKKLKI
ncbi:hypothetical protein HI814_14150 [Ralstonia solanacearum]|nr:hypothetical protein HI814_14150 [Ralstonia solanacearum]QKM33761.1 hypothetical protein HI794_14145 [Ralstonia solanacearum]QKM38748.1 hypothetical protein HI793_14155 [Ralstonia solanacearum]